MERKTGLDIEELNLLCRLLWRLYFFADSPAIKRQAKSLFGLLTRHIYNAPELPTIKIDA